MLVYKGSNRIFTHENLEKLRHLIEMDYDELTASSSYSNISYKIDKFLIATGLADIFIVINCFISFIIVIFYIISTYSTSITLMNTEDFKDYEKINNSIDTIEIFLLIYPIAHYFLRVYVSQDRLYFLFSFDSISDFGTIVPILLAKQGIFSTDIKYFFNLL
jgi:hypothetical protein